MNRGELIPRETTEAIESTLRAMKCREKRAKVAAVIMQPVNGLCHAPKEELGLLDLCLNRTEILD
jgi:hypothetical protein